MIDNSLADGQRFEDVYEHRAPHYETMNDCHHIKLAIDNLEPLLDELDALLPTLPFYDAMGHSECPFAPEMYEQKDRLTDKAVEKLATLRSHEKVLREEISRCERNLSRIGCDAAKVHRSETQDEYGESLGRQEEEYRDAMYEKDRVDAAIRRADATIAAARKMVVPETWSDESSANIGMSASTYANQWGSENIEQELDDLLEMGRMQ